MTCIIGLKDKNKIYFGGDSAATCDNFHSSITTESKVFVILQPQSDFIFGFTGYPRGLQLIKYSPWIPMYHEEEWSSVYEYMCTAFVSCLKGLFRNNGYSMIRDNQEDHSDQIMVGFKGHIFVVGNMYEVLEFNKDFVCIGSGSYHAEGSMEVLQRTKLSLEQKILESLKISEYYSAGVRNPFIIESI